jgi:hypothetical protein
MIPPFNTPPIKRQFTRSCFDVESNRLVLYGGLGEKASYLSDLWAFDADLSMWEELGNTGEEFPSEV